MQPPSYSLLGTPPTHQFWAEFHIDPPLAGVMNLLLTLAFLFLWVRTILQLLEERRDRRRADEAAERKSARPLHSGPTIIHGVVELAEAAAYAVEVDITQVGTESRTKNGYNHRWTESDRRVRAHDFYVRRANGDRVLVKPGEDPLLVDAVDHMEWSERTHRVRSAKLEVGEEVYVEGILSRGHDPEAAAHGAGYRSAGRDGWVMRAPVGERLHLSTEELGHRHLLRANSHLVTLMVLALTSLVALGSMWTWGKRYFEGVDVTAAVVGRNYFTTRDHKGNVSHHYQITYAMEVPLPPRQLSEELDRRDWSEIAVGDQVWVRWVPRSELATSLGRSASQSHFLWVLGLAAFGLALARAVYVQHSRRWYEGKLIDGGNGRLPNPPTLPSAPRALG